MMRKYETVIVYHPNLNKDRLDAEIKKVKELLESQGAVEVEIKQWGKRQLAYPAKKQSYGYYVIFFYNSEQHRVPAEAAAILRINDQVLKFQSHRINEHARRFKGNPRRLRSSLDEFEDLGAEDDTDEEAVA